jgi:hypothetical protein
VVFDTVSKSEKSGAIVPNGSMFDGVLAIMYYDVFSNFGIISIFKK